MDDGHSEHKLAEITGLKHSKIRAVIHAVEASPVSMDTPSHPTEDYPGVAREMPASHNVEASVLEGSIKDAVVNTMQSLPVIQQAIIALRYYENLELQVIAMELSLSLSVVREYHTSAITDIHAAMQDRVANNT